MLNGTLTLHDVKDVEKLCARALTDELRSLKARLAPHDHEDALAYLVGTAYELSLRYDPRRGWSFSKWSYTICRYRVSEWYGDHFPGRRRSERPVVLSLDHDGPGLALSVSDRLPTPDRDPDGIPVALTERSRHRARDVGVLREAVLKDLAA